jgi:hypothetical protein
MDEITIRTPNPKCRLYWCLIEFIGWRYGQSCWYFRPLFWNIAPLTFSLVHLSPPSQVYVFICTVWQEGGGDRVVWRSYTRVIHCVFDQIPSLQNCFTAPNKKPWRGGGLRQISTCHQVHLQVNFKKSGHLGFESISYFVHDSISTALTTWRALPECYQIKDCTRCQDLNPLVDHWLRSKIYRWVTQPQIRIPGLSLNGGASTENTEC